MSYIIVLGGRCSVNRMLAGPGPPSWYQSLYCGSYSWGSPSWPGCTSRRGRSSLLIRCCTPPALLKWLKSSSSSSSSPLRGPPAHLCPQATAGPARLQLPTSTRAVDQRRVPVCQQPAAHWRLGSPPKDSQPGRRAGNSAVANATHTSVTPVGYIT